MDNIKVEERKNKKKIIIGIVIAVVLAVVVISIITCNRRNSKFLEIDGIDRIEEPAGPPEAIVSVGNTPYLSEIGAEITIIYQGLVKKLIVTFSLHTNDHHPLGYVIIKEIRVSNSNEFEVYNIVYESNKYIESIHSNLFAEVTTGIVKLNGEVIGDKLFKEYFRTAEAMIMVYNKTKDGEVQTEDLKEAGERMTGRQFGNKF